MERRRTGEAEEAFEIEEEEEEEEEDEEEEEEPIDMRRFTGDRCFFGCELKKLKRFLHSSRSSFMFLLRGDRGSLFSCDPLNENMKPTSCQLSNRLTCLSTAVGAIGLAVQLGNAGICGRCPLKPADGSLD